VLQPQFIQMTMEQHGQLVIVLIQVNLVVEGLSESQYIEAPEGQLILVHRRGTYIIIQPESKDGGHTWAGMVQTDITNSGDNFGVMVGAVNITRTEYYDKAMFAISVAHDHACKNGRVYIGYMEKNRGTGLYELKFEIDGSKQFQAIGEPDSKFAYSSLAELGDGTIGESYISFAKIHLKR